MGFYVRKTQCSTCIYRKKDAEDGTPLYWDIETLEDQVKDEHGFFNSHRICHHDRVEGEDMDDRDVCCRGFWNRHKDEFPAGQMAQRLDAVIEVDDDGDEPEDDTLILTDQDGNTVTVLSPEYEKTIDARIEKINRKRGFD